MSGPNAMLGRVLSVFWPATVVLFLVMAWLTAQIRAGAGGLRTFDERLGGYSLTEAQAFLGALNAEGRELYLGLQGALDSAFPALFATALVLSFVKLFPFKRVMLFGALAVAGAVFDYRENALVAAMLLLDPASVSQAHVAAASRSTELKFAFDAAALLALVWGTAAYFLRRRRSAP